MSSESLKGLCLELAAATVERFLGLQWSDGRFATEPERETEEWNFFDQQYLLPAALLYVTEHPANRWQGDARLWDAILRNGRHLVDRVAEDGSMRWRLRGVVLDSPFVCQRLTCAWLLAYGLLRGRLPEADEAQWRRAMLAACGWLVEKHIMPHREVTRFTSHQIRTSTNHFSLYLSLLWLAGTEFERGEWVALASDLMRRLIADQKPAGYWEEHHGPTLGYDYLTYHGVEQYTTWSGDDVGLPALRLGMDTHQHWTYPDGIAVECLDGRMRHLSAPMLWGLAGFTRFPQGRGYARLLLERTGEKLADVSGETVARLAEGYLRAEEGEEETPAPLLPRYRATLEGVSVIRKEGPWVAAISGQCSPRWPESQFNLDRQARVSLWQAGAGLVLDGSNSKFQPELATFCRGEGEEADHVPQSARLVAGEGDPEDVVEAEHRGFRATVRSRMHGADGVEMRFEVAEGEGGPPVMLTLVPNISLGETFSLAGGAEVTLGEAALALNPSEHGGAIAFRGVRLHLPEGSRIEYPVSPFNSYSADNTSPPSANRLVVRGPVGRKGATLIAKPSS